MLCIMLPYHYFARKKVDNTHLLQFDLHFFITRSLGTMIHSYLNVVRPFRSKFVHSDEILCFLQKYIKFVIQKFKEMVRSFRYLAKNYVTFIRRILKNTITLRSAKYLQDLKIQVCHKFSATIYLYKI